MTSLVSICVATYQRPELLAHLLEGLARLEFPSDLSPEISVIVVDNDGSGSAKEVCDRIQLSFPYPLIYEIESQQGISYARNRSVALAQEGTEFVAFIDDDEVPDPDWLEQLLVMQTQQNADVVWGNVVPVLDDPETPEWAIAGQFFQTRDYPDGGELDVAATNNALVRLECLKSLGTEPFDRRFALTGGEDTHLFMRLHSAGYKIVWAAQALVRERVPANRTTVKWILQRGYRTWGSHSLCERELRTGITTQSIRFAKGVALIGIGVLRLPLAIAGQAFLVKSLLSMARGFGTLSGLVGYSVAEYGDGEQVKT